MNSKITAVCLLAILMIMSACKDSSTATDSEETNTSQAQARQVSNDGYTNENGDLIDKVDNSFRDSASTPVLQTADNKVFKPGRKFVYDYMYYNDRNQERLCALVPPEVDVPSRKAYYYTPPTDLNELVLMEIHITVLPGLGLLENVRKEYQKTTAKYSYKLYNSMADVSEQSGIVENEENIWMTPPRFKIFRMLEFNPYPYIKAPFEVGNKWTWEHEIRTRWGDAQWLVLHEPLPNTYTYEITDKKKMATAFGEIECFVVEAEAKNEFGEAYLTSYFHPEYGFVRLEYTNLHYTKMILNLKEIVQLEEPVLY